jgi:DNA-binding NtrC family response regulator
MGLMLMYGPEGRELTNEAGRPKPPLPQTPVTPPRPLAPPNVASALPPVSTPVPQPPKPSPFPPARTTIHISVPPPPNPSGGAPAAGPAVATAPPSDSEPRPRVEPATGDAQPIAEPSSESSSQHERALAVDDDPQNLEAVASFLEDHGFEVDRADGIKSARRKLARQTYDVVVTDLQLQDGDGLDVLRAARERAMPPEVLVLTGHATIETAVEAIRQGARDYLRKPIDPGALEVALERTKEPRARAREVRELRTRLEDLGSFGPIVGRAKVMRELYRKIELVAPTNARVLIVGESGSGKEVIARAIHERSRRAEGPFFAVNCGAITETLIESELFGHERGAFTGARNKRQGVFELACGGTLFLDEITEMSAEMQVRLLRVLETGKYRRVGGAEELATDARVLAATNRDPLKAIAEGKLREDLYYRLNVFRLDAPPLRERREDVPLLARAFLDQFARSNEREPVVITTPALDLLMAFDWPGNVRELKNVMETAFILSPDGRIRVDALPAALRKDVSAEESKITLRATDPLRDNERRLILAALAVTEGDRRRAAKMLGVSRKTLYNKLKQYREDGKIREEDGRIVSVEDGTASVPALPSTDDDLEDDGVDDSDLEDEEDDE